MLGNPGNPKKFSLKPGLIILVDQCEAKIFCNPIFMSFDFLFQSDGPRERGPEGLRGHLRMAQALPLLADRRSRRRRHRQPLAHLVAPQSHAVLFGKNGF